MQNCRGFTVSSPRSPCVGARRQLTRASREEAGSGYVPRAVTSTPYWPRSLPAALKSISQYHMKHPTTREKVTPPVEPRGVPARTPAARRTVRAYACTRASSPLSPPSAGKRAPPGVGLASVLSHSATLHRGRGGGWLRVRVGYLHRVPPLVIRSLYEPLHHGWQTLLLVRPASVWSINVFQLQQVVERGDEARAVQLLCKERPTRSEAVEAEHP